MLLELPLDYFLLVGEISLDCRQSVLALKCHVNVSWSAMHGYLLVKHGIQRIPELITLSSQHSFLLITYVCILHLVQALINVSELLQCILELIQ